MSDERGRAIEAQVLREVQAYRAALAIIAGRCGPVAQAELEGIAEAVLVEQDERRRALR